MVIEVPMEVVDSIGRLEMETLGQGKAWILNNGRKQDGLWLKESAKGRMRFLTSGSGQAVFMPGVMWIEVVGSLESLGYTEQR